MLSVFSVADRSAWLVNWLSAGAARLHHLLLRRHLHDVAEALDAAEHRHRRRRRRLPADDRLGRVTGGVSPREHRAVPHHLPLDAAAFLGARAVQDRATTARAGVPMMPNVAGEASTQRQILVYSRAAGADRRAALAARLRQPRLRHRCRRRWASASSGIAWTVLRMPDSDRVMKPAKKLFGYSILYLFAIFAGLSGRSRRHRACVRAWTAGWRCLMETICHADRQAEEGAPQPQHCASALALGGAGRHLLRRHARRSSARRS